MEIKWNPVKGRFSHKAHLRRLAGLQKRNLRKSFQVMKLPTSWEKALEGYVTRGFAWQSESVNGKGVLIYCPDSRMASLVQFYRQNTAAIEPAASRLLTSFQDQNRRASMPWAVFDIRAEIPAEFELKRFRFDAGRYELIFSTKHRQLRMFRWSPAAVLLRQRDLLAMAREVYTPKGSQSPVWLQRDDTEVECQSAPASIVALVANRIRRRPAYRFLRLWHEIEKNRILGVQNSGKNPIDRRQFAAICEKYETV